MKKKKPYKLPKSLRTNAAFDDFRRFLNGRFLPGVQVVLKDGERCPREARVVRMAALIFGVPFIKVRPLWLVDDETGARLELDGYSDERKLAVEYQSGAHHYLCEKTLYREKLKRKACAARGVTLLEIWPENHTRRVLLQFLEVMGAAKVIPRRSTLWYGCWLNSLVGHELFSHTWLTNRSVDVSRN